MIAKNKVHLAKKARRNFVEMRQDSPIALGNFFVSEACFAAVAAAHGLRANSRTYFIEDIQSAKTVASPMALSDGSDPLITGFPRRCWKSAMSAHE